MQRRNNKKVVNRIYITTFEAKKDVSLSLFRDVDRAETKRTMPKIKVGIGDIIGSWALLDAQAKRTQKLINVAPEEEFVDNRGPEYAKFLSRFLPMVFDEDHFVCSSESSRERIFDWHLCTEDPSPVNFTAKLTNPTNLPANKYVCVSSKVRELEREIVFEACSKVAKILKQHGITVVILGEKKVEFNGKYKLTGYKTIYPIYERWKKELPDAIDMTIPTLGVKAPDIDRLRSDLSVMSKALFCINFGVGGSLMLSASVGRSQALLSSRWYNHHVIQNLFPKMFGQRERHFCMIENLLASIQKTLERHSTDRNHA